MPAHERFSPIKHFLNGGPYSVCACNYKEHLDLIGVTCLRCGEKYRGPFIIKHGKQVAQLTESNRSKSEQGDSYAPYGSGKRTNGGAENMTKPFQCLHCGRKLGKCCPHRCKGVLRKRNRIFKHIITGEIYGRVKYETTNDRLGI